jgi:hypothetical protein
MNPINEQGTCDECNTISHNLWFYGTLIMSLYHCEFCILNVVLIKDDVGMS